MPQPLTAAAPTRSAPPAWATRPGRLSTTLSAELATLRHAGRSDEVLEVLASCLRLQEDARLLLQHRGRIRALSVYPRLGRCHLPRAAGARSGALVQDLAVIAVETADPPPPAGLQPLAPVLWQLVWQAPGPQLLAMLRGDLAFRIAPGLPACDWFPPALREAARRLRDETTPLAALARWPGLDAAQAVRLLNGAYLQGSLMRLHHPPGHAVARSEAD